MSDVTYYDALRARNRAFFAEVEKAEFGTCRRCARYRVCRDGVCFACAEVAPIQETLTVHVASESDPKLTYTLHAQNGVAVCNCLGHSTHGHCKHSDALMRVLEMEKAQ